MAVNDLRFGTITARNTRDRSMSSAAVFYGSTGNNAGQSAPVEDVITVKTVAYSNVSSSGLYTLNGVALASGDLVLLTQQTSAVDNGVYQAVSGTWNRITNDLNKVDKIIVSSGFAAGSELVLMNRPKQIGTDSLNFKHLHGVHTIETTPAAVSNMSVVPIDIVPILSTTKAIVPDVVQLVKIDNGLAYTGTSTIYTKFPSSNFHHRVNSTILNNSGNLACVMSTDSLGVFYKENPFGEPFQLTASGGFSVAGDVLHVRTYFNVIDFSEF